MMVVMAPPHPSHSRFMFSRRSLRCSRSRSRSLFGGRSLFGSLSLNFVLFVFVFVFAIFGKFGLKVVLGQTPVDDTKPRDMQDASDDVYGAPGRPGGPPLDSPLDPFQDDLSGEGGEGGSNNNDNTTASLLLATITIFQTHELPLQGAPEVYVQCFPKHGMQDVKLNEVDKVRHEYTFTNKVVGKFTQDSDGWCLRCMLKEHDPFPLRDDNFGGFEICRGEFAVKDTVEKYKTNEFKILLKCPSCVLHAAAPPPSPPPKPDVDDGDDGRDDGNADDHDHDDDDDDGTASWWKVVSRHGADAIEHEGDHVGMRLWDVDHVGLYSSDDCSSRPLAVTSIAYSDDPSAHIPWKVKGHGTVYNANFGSGSGRGSASGSGHGSGHYGQHEARAYVYETEDGGASLAFHLKRSDRVRCVVFRTFEGTPDRADRFPTSMALLMDDDGPEGADPFVEVARWDDIDMDKPWKYLKVSNAEEPDVDTTTTTIASPPPSPPPTTTTSTSEAMPPSQPPVPPPPPPPPPPPTTTTTTLTMTTSTTTTAAPTTTSTTSVTTTAATPSSTDSTTTVPGSGSADAKSGGTSIDKSDDDGRKIDPSPPETNKHMLPLIVGALIMCAGCGTLVALVIRRNRRMSVSNSRAYAYHGLESAVPGDFQLDVGPLEVAAFEPVRPDAVEGALGGPPPRETALTMSKTPGGLKLTH